MTKSSRMTIGVDVGDRRSHFCVLDDAGEVVERGDFRTTPAHLKRMLAGHAGATVAFETGSHALWMRREVEAADCGALEANPRQVRLIYGGHTKNDRLDAENLGRLARLDAELLSRYVRGGTGTSGTSPGSRRATSWCRRGLRWPTSCAAWSSRSGHA